MRIEKERKKMHDDKNGTASISIKSFFIGNLGLREMFIVRLTVLLPH